MPGLARSSSVCRGSTRTLASAEAAPAQEAWASNRQRTPAKVAEIRSDGLTGRFLHGAQLCSKPNSARDNGFTQCGCGGPDRAPEQPGHLHDDVPLALPFPRLGQASGAAGEGNEGPGPRASFPSFALVQRSCRAGLAGSGWPAQPLPARVKAGKSFPIRGCSAGKTRGKGAGAWGSTANHGAQVFGQFLNCFRRRAQL